MRATESSGVGGVISHGRATFPRTTAVYRMEAVKRGREKRRKRKKKERCKLDELFDGEMGRIQLSLIQVLVFQAQDDMIAIMIGGGGGKALKIRWQVWKRKEFETRERERK